MAYWIFQSMPDNFDLPGALKEAPQHDNELVFLAKQREADIMPGDTVYLCFGGRGNPGLYATATVLTRPAVIPPEDWQRKYAIKPLRADEKAEAPRRVRLKVDHLLDVPVARSDIYELPEVAGHQFVTARTGTNFWLTPEQASAIERLITVPGARGPYTQ
jgi:EVE domain